MKEIAWIALVRKATQLMPINYHNWMKGIDFHKDDFKGNSNSNKNRIRIQNWVRDLKCHPISIHKFKKNQMPSFKNKIQKDV